MKLNELKCKNCGSIIHVEPGNETVTCKFCKTTYSVDDAYSDGYKYEKGRQKAINEQFGESIEQMNNFMKNNPVAKTGRVITVIAFLIFAFIFSFAAYQIFNGFKETNESNKQFEVSQFNNTLENLYNGSEYGTSVINALDEVMKINNKNGKHLIEVTFRETTTKDSNEIIGLKKEFEDWTKYNISYKYDDEGYIAVMVIQDLN